MASEKDVQGLEAEWEALHSSCYRASACATYSWVMAWWEAFCNKPGGTKSKLFVMAVRDPQENLVAVLPFYEEEPAVLGPRRLRPIGNMAFDGVWAMTEEPCVLLRDGLEIEILRLVGVLLARFLKKGRWDMVVLQALYEGEGPFTEGFVDSFRPFCATRVELMSGSTRAELPGSWRVYRKELSKSMRDNLGYYSRLLTRDGHDWSVRQIRDPKEIDEACLRLVNLHQCRSKSTRGVQHDSHIDGPLQADFLRRIMARLSAQGKALVGELLVDGKVVAGQAFVEEGDQLMVYYSGYEEAWYKYSPIFVIDTVVFQEALERGIRSLNFLGSKRQWTMRWNASWTESLHRVVIVPKRPLSLTRSGLLIGTYAGRKALESGSKKASAKIASFRKRKASVRKG